MKNLLLAVLLLLSISVSVSLALGTHPNHHMANTENCAADGDEKISGKHYSMTLPYPNPASSTVTIQYSIETHVKTAEIIVHNVLGATVLKKELASGNQIVELSVEDLKPGIYFYSLELDGLSQFTKRLVIKR